MDDTQQEVLLQRSVLQEKLAEQKVISPHDNRIEVRPTGNIFYAKLILREGHVYATDNIRSFDDMLGLITIRNFSEETFRTKKNIKVTKVHFYNAEGELT